MSEFIFIEDTGQTADLKNPPDYSWRLTSGGGCLGSIHCEECGCIMAAKGSHCFCMGIYDCPRCGYEKKPINYANIDSLTSPIVYERIEQMETDNLIDNVRQWHHQRNLIDGSTDEKQIGKLEEEFDELKASCAAGNSPIDDIGDMMVVLINIAERNKLDLVDCLIHAWDEIKDRKGKMIDGIFVKESDLHKFE